MEYKLSPSNLNLFKDCSRCFWLKMVKKINRPLGPMSSIPIKMDSIIKHYFDKYRDIGQLPPIIEGKVTGCLAVGMPKTLKHEIEDGIIALGRPDEYLKLEDNSIVTFDHKTKSKAPEYIHPSYQLQLDVYSYLLKAMGYKTTNKAYLAFYYPDECELHEGMPFNCTIFEVNTDYLRVERLIENAFAVLNGDIPDYNDNCNYCKWNKEIIKL